MVWQEKQQIWGLHWDCKLVTINSRLNDFLINNQIQLKIFDKGGDMNNPVCGSLSSSNDATDHSDNAANLTETYLELIQVK